MKRKINGRKRKIRPRGTIILKNLKNKMSLPNYRAMKRLKYKVEKIGRSDKAKYLWLNK